MGRNISESAFETAIEAVLVGSTPSGALRETSPGYGAVGFGPGGYRKGSSAEYDRTRGLITHAVTGKIDVRGVAIPAIGPVTGFG